MKAYQVLGGLIAFLPFASLWATDIPTDIRGEVKRIYSPSESETKQGLLAILEIEGPKTTDISYDQANVRIVRSTVIKKRVGSELKDATLKDLTVGTRVEGHLGAVNNDFTPIKARGDLIIILPPAEKK
jgi:hypothetical protein